ncbi:MAG: threonine synthase, partial [Halobacteriaceae archaeon]
MEFDLSGEPRPGPSPEGAYLSCISCGEHYPPFGEALQRCEECAGLLEVRYDSYSSLSEFDGEGVWRYSKVLPDVERISLQEGDTPLISSSALADELDVDSLHVKHEGLNPTGSFKDRGMTVGISVARNTDQDMVVCASTGNTSASLASYSARANLECVVLLPKGNVARGKVAQAALHDATICEIKGNFDQCLDIAAEMSGRGDAYILNSLNPHRLEGQKSIGYEILEECLEMNGSFPDRIVLPAGNAGNVAALYKCFRELKTATNAEIEDYPSIVAIQAAGAAPLVDAIKSGEDA